MERKVESLILKHSLLDAGKKHLVALSGGADSVALLRILRALDYQVEAVHCNFHLRGDESNRDEAFCHKFCEGLGVPLHVAHFDTHTYAELHKVSIEMAARDLRYGYFRQLRKDLSAADICVAHHKDDQAETLLLNIVRGTGMRGLKGMQFVNGDIVRPLLCVSRSEILAYLERIGQDYIVDSSNLVADVKRNKLRLNILPMLHELNPSVVDALCTMAENISSVEPYALSALEAEKERVLADGKEIDIKALQKTPDVEALLYYILESKGFNRTQTKEMADALSAQSGTLWESATHCVQVHSGKLIVDENRPLPKEYQFPEEGCYLVSEGAHLRIERKVSGMNESVDKDPMVATLDADKVRFPLSMRRLREGDRFVPFGMKGSKLVSDFLADKKVPLTERRRQMLLVDADDNPLWLIGLRPDDRYCVGSDTINRLILRYIK